MTQFFRNTITVPLSDFTQGVEEVYHTSTTSGLRCRRRLLFLGDTDVTFRGLSVCLFVTFVHCAETGENIDTISFASCLSHVALKFGLHQPNPPSQILTPK